MNYCDLHCDTPLKLYETGGSLLDGEADVTVEKLGFTDKYVQLAAYCPPAGDSDGEAYEKFYRVREAFLKEAEQSGCAVCTDAAEIDSALGSGKASFVLTVEDARILEGDVQRLKGLYDLGVRAVTPLWSGVTCIGGAHDTDFGLTEFGLEAVRECAMLGMILDISHASPASAEEIMSAAERFASPVMASHSCSRELFDHTRNLSDSQLKRLVSLGGIVGVNLYPPHLTGGEATAMDAVRHIKHFISVAGEDAVALGCDLDGMGQHPADVRDVSMIPCLYGAMESVGFTDAVIEKVMFRNAYDFLRRSLRAHP